MCLCTAVRTMPPSSSKPFHDRSTAVTDSFDASARERWVMPLLPYESTYMYRSIQQPMRTTREASVLRFTLLRRVAKSAAADGRTYYKRCR